MARHRQQWRTREGGSGCFVLLTITMIVHVS